MLISTTNRQPDFKAYNTAQPLIDSFGRKMAYLRLSLTESCNIACQYCLPKGFPDWYRHKARLSREDLETLMLGFRGLAFSKIRFTGGEPTIHPDCLWAVQRAKDLGFEHVALTSNGLMIKDIYQWKLLGLDSINISLDSIRPDTFKTITGSDGCAQVMRLIEQSVAADILTKVNTVLLKSVNGGQIEELIDWAMTRKLTLRFIELMPTGLNHKDQMAELVKNDEIIPLLEKLGFLLDHDPVEQASRQLLGPARVYRHPDFPGKIGLISPLSCNFCSACNRLRVTAQGKLRLCLFGSNDIDLDLSSGESVAETVRSVIVQKLKSHDLENRNWGNVQTFRTIGG